MKKFKLHWIDGKVDVVEGTDIADAFSKAGFGAGALKALDWFEEIFDCSCHPMPMGTNPACKTHGYTNKKGGK